MQAGCKDALSEQDVKLAHCGLAAIAAWLAARPALAPSCLQLPGAPTLVPRAGLRTAPGASCAFDTAHRNLNRPGVPSGDGPYRSRKHVHMLHRVPAMKPARLLLSRDQICDHKCAMAQTQELVSQPSKSQVQSRSRLKAIKDAPFVRLGASAHSADTMESITCDSCSVPVYKSERVLAAVPARGSFSFLQPLMPLSSQSAVRWSRGAAGMTGAQGQGGPPPAQAWASA